MRDAWWVNDKTKAIATGTYDYWHSNDTFYLNVRYSNGRQRQFALRFYDKPEWGNWKLVERKPEVGEEKG